MKKRETMAVIVSKTARGLVPVSAFDAELIDTAALGTEYRLTKLTKRSLPQQRTYWKALAGAVHATGKWPTPEHLHDALKRACGYVEINHDLAGNPFITSDSTSFDAMSADEFKAYMDLAMEKLSDAVGFDPLAFLDAKQAA